MSALTIGVPSKGRLQDDTIAWFADRGMQIVRDGAEREYAVSVKGIRDVTVQLLSAGEIPRELAAGRIHMGVTGRDLVHERIANHEQVVDMQFAMGFGYANLIVAVPAFWIDVETMHDLDEVAYDFRRSHGHPLRIATKYHNLARQFLHEKGVAEYRLVDSQGATEAAPKNLTAEAIIDITSSGETLRANHLKVLDDGLILPSEAMLCVSRTANWGAVSKDARAQIEAHLGIAF
ncbi:MAG: ATP phosphoribosyltransferase [Pseudomonadota bacterium]